MDGEVWLTLGAGLSFGLALLHLIIIVGGVPAYEYFGAPDLARKAAQGSLQPALVTLGVAAVFAVFGLYALSGSGVVGPLPLLTPGLIVIGSVYTLRGLVVVRELASVARGSTYPVRMIFFSATSLVIGLIHLLGVYLSYL